MGKLAKLAFMAMGLFVALYGVVTLKTQLGASATTPTRLSVDGEPTVSEPPPLSRSRVSHQPTILEHRPKEADLHQASPAYLERPTGGAVGAVGEPEPIFPIVPAVPYRQSTMDDPSDSGPAIDTAPIQPGYPPTQSTSVSPSIGVPHQLAEHVVQTAAELGTTGASSGWPTESAVQQTTWRTREDDSLWDISLARYGTGAYYHALFAYNRSRIKRPDRLPAGLELETPQASVLHEQFPHLCKQKDDWVVPAVTERPRQSTNPR